MGLDSSFAYLTNKKPLVSDGALQHYGVGHTKGGNSGRYPWGSGDNPLQRIGEFSDRVRYLRKQGLTDKDIIDAINTDYKEMGFQIKNTNDLRIYYRADNNRRKTQQTARIHQLQSEGRSISAIAKEMDIPEGTVRSLLNEQSNARTLAATNAAKEIMRHVDDKKYIDIGAGVETELGISKEKLNEAIAIMQLEGYNVVGVSVPQANNRNQRTTIMAAIPPGVDPKQAQRDLYSDPTKLESMRDYTIREDKDGSEHLDKKFVYPASLDSKRLFIRYADDVGPDGAKGIERDGVIQIRPNVPDLDLGGSNYAQVRILVDGEKYLKGMAVYSNDIPEGYDIVFNTNKTPEKADKVLKPIKEGEEGKINPFGAMVKDGGQYYYIDEKTGERKLGLINKARDEGDWDKWSHELPAQFLAKQPQELIEKQLKATIEDAEDEYRTIMAIDNPTIRRHFLNEYASKCDANAVDLKAAALPRQQYQVILPVPGLHDNEVFAPNYKNGEKVALIRFPHAGPFEIPILTVNNKTSAVDPNMLTVKDAIGINSKNAEKLSGADFDGDTCLVIPCNSNSTDTRIRSQDTLKGLEGFDPKMAYPSVPGMKKMTKQGTGMEMGRITNLIMDMYQQSAPDDEMARAVRHSMVVIDAEKHELNYKLSEKENDIAGLRRKYQHKLDKNGNDIYGGGTTLLTRAGARVDIPKRRGSGRIDPDTGNMIYREANEYYHERKKMKGPDGKDIIDPNTGKPLYQDTGKIKLRTQKSKKMAEVKDARELSSGFPQEEAYASFANKMKEMARTARKSMFGSDKKLIKLAYEPSAAVAYKDEVSELMHELTLAKLNAPKERKAQSMAEAYVKSLQAENPSMTKEEMTKKGTQALNRYREIYGAKRHKISISDKQWEAIQSGAIHDNVMKEILRYSDPDILRQRAIPKSYTTTISEAKQRRIRAMRDVPKGQKPPTNAEIADALGISVSTVIKYAGE